MIVHTLEKLINNEYRVEVVDKDGELHEVSKWKARDYTVLNVYSLDDIIVIEADDGTWE